MNDEVNYDRSKVNNQIRTYWLEMRNSVNRDPVVKKKVPDFTRHNGRKLKRLKNKGWRFPKGTKCNIPTRPKIGYKNSKESRGRKVNGLKLIIVNSIADFKSSSARKDYQVFCFAKAMGTKKRKELLEYCKSNKLPLYITMISF